jgi:phospholipid/cholesterol/gamma-HCH transport system substrate-binding protein
VDTKVNYAVVGVFVLALSAVLIAGILWLAVGAGGQKHYQPYMAIINESVAGLNLDATVKYLGVDVGKVRTIRLNPSNPQEVQLIFAIEQGTPIKENTEAVLKTQGLTGIAYVELSGGTPDSPSLEAAPGQYPIIHTKPSLSARLENILTTALARLDLTAANINALLDNENREEVKKFLANASLMMSTIASQKAEISSLITNATKTANHAARAAAHIEPTLARISKSAEALEKMADEAALAGTSTKKTVEEIGTGMHQFTGETLPEMERLMEELNVLSGSLQRLSNQTERNPSSLLRGRQPVPLGPGEKTSP